MKIYELNQNKEWSGRSEPSDEWSGCPAGWLRTTQEPPTPTPPEVVFWTGTDWAIRSEPLPIPEVVPEKVSRAQGKAVLILHGFWDSIVVYVQNITDPTQKALAETALYDTQYWQRDSPFLRECAQALGISEETLDLLFIEAEKIHL